MGLIEKITEDIKQAMLAKEKDKLESLRAIKAALLLTKTEKGGNDEISNDQELKILQKLVKQRKESAEIFKTQNRDDLYQKEVFEASIIEKYLPAQLSEEEIVNTIKNIIAQMGTPTATDFGKIMGAANKQFAGKADNKIVAEKIKSLLAN